MLLILLVSILPISTVQATGPLEQICPRCNGTGTILQNTTITCPNCHGAGNASTQIICDQCNGTGLTSIFTSCSTCKGSGKVDCPVTTHSKTSFENFDGSTSSFISCQFTVKNEADQETYCIAEATVHVTGGVGPHFQVADYTITSGRTRLVPHTDTTITIDTPENGIFLSFTYDIYLISVDQIICSDCQGVGGFFSNVTCDKCNGVGTVTVNGICSECNGTGTVTLQENLTCPECHGTGYILNWLTAVLVAVGIIVIVAVGSIGAFMFHKKKT
jgi:DnaJ-class molecular chaperone